MAAATGPADGGRTTGAGDMTYLDESPEPCKYCGHASHKIDDYRLNNGRVEYQVRCAGCGMCGPIAIDRQRAIMHWNFLQQQMRESPEAARLGGN